jgi:hypothetical protein
VACDPLTGSPPDHPPEAAQVLACAVDQLKVEPPPLTTLLGLAVSRTVGAGAGEVTDTVADCVPTPPGPVQVSEYVSFAVKAPVDCEPLTGLAPDQAPEAMHEVALLDDQVNMAELPLVIVLGPAAIATVGCGGVTDTTVDCVALPPAPVQVSV